MPACRPSILISVGAVVASLCLTALPTQTHAATLADTYATIKKSLALIAYPSGKDGIITGSSFCIYSTATTAYFLTNAHVVGTQKVVGVFLATNPHHTYVGYVIRTNTTIDAAVVAVDVANIPPLTLANDTLPEGQAIAIAGYPSAQIQMALAGMGLSPSVHAGIINAYPESGVYIELDAQVEHGNSGGPIFDPDTGIVYGMVTYKLGSDQTNLGIAINQLSDFLANAKVSPYGETRFAGDAVDTVFAWLRRWPATIASASFKLFETGGRINTVPPTATAFVHRNSVWLSSIGVLWEASTTASELQRNLDWQSAFYAAIVPLAKGGAFQNFIDPSLTDWKTAYYGANLARLEAIKKRVDPTGVFRFPESIG
jgi:hypothetical protein